MNDGHYHLRRLDDPTNVSGTLLTLPLSDFPIVVDSSAARSGAVVVVSPSSRDVGNNNSSINDACEEDDIISDDDEGGLILMSLPPGILSIDDLITSNVYIMGPNDDDDDSNGRGGEGRGTTNNTNAHDGAGNSIEPVSARLIIEDKLGKTLILTRVETSNTYIVVPPMKVDTMTMTNDDDEGIHQTEGGNKKKKRKLLSSSETEIDNITPSNQMLVTMLARSVGQIPGESSPATFFLEPTLLPPNRHFANVLREILYRATYDPFDPPPTTATKTTTKKLGYTIHELARLCRTSHAEVSNAIHGRYFGAEDALVLPSCSSSSDSLRYGTLSEEGRRTVYSAILSTLVESDTELQWLSSTGGMEEGDGMPLSSLINEIRECWTRSEGGTSSSSSYHLPDEVIWSCLRPIFVGVNKATDKPTPGDNDCGIPSSMPQLGWLDPNGVAKLVAHEVFLRGGVRTPHGSGGGGGSHMTWWKEDELIEAWSMRLPTIPGGYVPNVRLLRGIAICEPTSSSTATTMPWDNDDIVEGDDAYNTNTANRRWRYFPEAFGLHPSDPVLRIRSLFTMRDAWTVKETMPYLEKLLIEYGGIGVGGKELSLAVVDLLGRHARATVINVETNGKEETTSVTRYIAKV